MTTNGVQELDYVQAKQLMRGIFRRESLDVGVFVDRGWGDAPLQITIIVNGDGQRPVASLSRETYQQLLADGIVGENTLRTHKARKFHQFKGSSWQNRVMDVAADFPKLSVHQQECVRRATLRVARKGLSQRAKPAATSGWSREYELALPVAGLKLTFGYNDWSGRYLQSVVAL